MGTESNRDGGKKEGTDTAILNHITNNNEAIDHVSSNANELDDKRDNGSNDIPTSCNSQNDHSPSTNSANIEEMQRPTRSIMERIRRSIFDFRRSTAASATDSTSSSS